MVILKCPNEGLELYVKDALTVRQTNPKLRKQKNGFKECNFHKSTKHGLMKVSCEIDADWLEFCLHIFWQSISNYSQKRIGDKNVNVGYVLHC